ncbi:MAG: alpha/beta fold hydrolase [Nanoarchaeota archaeon]
MHIHKPTSKFIPLFDNRHIQTILGLIAKGPRPPDSYKNKRILINIKEGKLAIDCTFQKKKNSPTLLIIHGLTGSSNSAYVERMSRHAYTDGFNIIRMNMRGCGNTANLTPSIYNAGQSSDLQAVISYLIKNKHNNISIVSYSLGGNLALKWAGEYISPKQVFSLTAISPAIDLEEAGKASEKTENWLYKLKILLSLKSLIKQKHIHLPNLYDLTPLSDISSVKDFDSIYQTKNTGYMSIRDYYDRASAIKYIKNIHIPTLIITSKDDPLVPVNSFYNKDIRKNKHINLIITNHGGHAGFLGKSKKERYWSDLKTLEFIQHNIIHN